MPTQVVINSIDNLIGFFEIIFPLDIFLKMYISIFYVYVSDGNNIFLYAAQMMTHPRRRSKEASRNL